MNPYGSVGQFHYGQGRYIEAIQEFTRELGNSPDDATIYAWIALSHTHLDNPKPALENAKKAVSLEPDNDFAFYSLAHSHLVANQYKKAEEAIRKAIEIEPYFAGYFGTLAATLGQQGHWRAALEAAETGLQLDPENENCARIRAHALSLAGRSKDAVVAAQETIEENPDSSHAHATLGWVRLRQGDHKAAQSHFAEALRLDPSEELARDGLLDSLRSRFPPYRWIIQFYAWQAQFSKGGQLVILIAILAIPRILRAIGRNNPQWQPFLIPIGVCFSFLIWFTWIGEPLTNITLLAHPLGRLALEKHVRFETIVMAIYLGLALVSFGLGFLVGPGVFIAAGCLFVGLVLMALSAKIDSTRWLRHALFGGTAALSGIAAIAFWLISFIKL